MFVVQSCSQSGATYGICCMVTETISVLCSEHSYWHGAPNLAPNGWIWWKVPQMMYL